eukprot:CAMPEP_0114250030 /NCGR_PEP_ID=MMETSP0058-20121206/14477_1 /TAXON_ID=36894 /ORGANISM="Pyramimonas parkeae, CCMP726" /LENGTH=456 /DNA_ID=CAMNT_0001363653 /DNA_START=251 /DNA_END=1621 /DNA_ORIENTATION=-
MFEDSNVFETSIKNLSEKHADAEQAFASGRISPQLIKCRARNKSANQHDRRLKASSSMLPKAAPSNVEGSAAVNTGIHVSDPANEIEHILQNQEDYYRVLKVDRTSSSATIKMHYQEPMRAALASKSGHPCANEAMDILSSARSTLLNAVTKKLYTSYLLGASEPHRNGASQTEPPTPRQRVYHLPRYMRTLLRTPILGLLWAILFVVIMVPIVIVLLLLLSIWYLACSPLTLLLRGDASLPESDISDMSSLVQPSEAAEERQPLKEQVIVQTQKNGSLTKTISEGETSSKDEDVMYKTVITHGKLKEMSTSYMDLVSQSLSEGSPGLHAGPATWTESTVPYDYGMFKPMELERTTSLSDSIHPRAVFKQFNAQPFLFHTYGGSGKCKNPIGLSLYNTYSGPLSSDNVPSSYTDNRPMSHTVGGGDLKLEGGSSQKLALPVDRATEAFGIDTMDSC